MRVFTDICYVPDTHTPFPERWLADMHLPSAGSGDCLIWIHGGGLTGGDKRDAVIAMPAGWAVIRPNYRFLRQAPWPACIDDVARVVAWAEGALVAQGFACRRLFLGGISAGAYLAAMVGLERRWLAAHHRDPSCLAGVIALSGQMTSHFAYREALGHPPDRPLLDHAAPLWHVRADAPPLLLIAGSEDLPCRPQENLYMEAAMRSVGHLRTSCHIIPGRTHETIGSGLQDPDDPVVRLIRGFVVPG